MNLTNEINSSVSLPEKNGLVHIAEDVIASIAALAASEVEGVASLTGMSGSSVAQWMGKKNPARGVKVTLEENTASFHISLSLNYGYTITLVSRKVQDAVKSAVESMTGLSVTSVNVQIASVTFEKAKKESKK